MDFTLTKAQEEFSREITDFARNNLNDEQYLEKFSPEMWEKLSDFGLLGITAGEEYGGLGESFTMAAAAYEALGYGCKNNGLIFAVTNHVWVGQNLIYLYGSQELKEKYMPDLVSGKRIASMAITESESGSDALSMASRAVKSDGGYVLNGTKMFISNGSIADIFIVFVITDEKPMKKLTAFVVERTSEGLSVGPDIEKMGLGASPMNELILNNCTVPAENILGSFNQGSSILTGALEWERCFEFAPHIGTMRRITEECLAHVKQRKQFGKEIGEYQALSHKIADMAVATEMARLMLYKIAWLKDNKRSAFLETSIFKLFVSENYIKTCRDAVQIFGAYGYTKEYGLERELRDALACSIYSGTNEMQRNTIYRMMPVEHGWQQ